MTRIVLASRSPRRQELLRALGLAFETAPSDVDETALEGETPAAMVDRLSRDKARACRDGREDDALVIAADTTVVVDGAMLAKPADEAENAAFLKRLQGRDHHVLTGHTLARGARQETRVVDTLVRFRALDDEEIGRYVASGEGLDKAGGYAIQGRGSALVASIEGCYFNVVGLSVPVVVDLARLLGVRLV